MQTHWENTYAAKAHEKLGWYEPHLRTSLEWIRDLRLPPDAPIIDAGGGASTLVDDLLDEGHQDITVVDLSARALESAKTRLGAKARMVSWLQGDITSVDLPASHFELWHDRAAFHFLTAPEQQKKYGERLRWATRPGAHVIMGTFALEAPPMCSGLPVQRYTPQSLVEALGVRLELLRERKELHVTPGGVEQIYLYCLLRRTA